ncbi:hypothetical protein ACFLTE_10845 [Bacteroidota bacterium]
MKKLTLYSLILTFLLSGCASPEKLLQKGKYDAAINKAVKVLKRKPTSEKNIIVLEKAYKIANEKDKERIKFLQLEGRADRWDEIFQLYSSLKYRQSKVKTVTPLNLYGKRIDFPYVDYDKEIVTAKSNAAEYFYAHGKKLMQEQKVESYRQAYYEFKKVKDYKGDYNDVNRLLEESKFKGTSRVLIKVVNNTALKLPQDYLNDLIAFSTSGLNSEWTEYHTKVLKQDVFYNYSINITLQKIAVSPDLVNENDQIFKKKIEDGFEYVLDNNGNVMKDTAGNDIKIAKYKNIQCTLINKNQRKSAKITGKIDFISNDPKRQLKSVPISTKTIFEHNSARAVGDIEALDQNAKKAITRRSGPFPTDIDLIIQTTENMQQTIRTAIIDNKHLIN